MSEFLLKHAENPWGFNPTFKPTSTGKAVLLTCNDEITMKVRVGLLLRQLVIKDIGFTGHGCVLCMAASSLLCEYVLGDRVSTILDMEPHELCDLMNTDIPEPRMRCVQVSLQALRKAIA